MTNIGYSRQWRDLRFRVRLSWFLILVYQPLLLGLLWSGEIAWPGFEDRVGWRFVIPAFVPVAIALLYRFSFRCPRCEKWFFSRDDWQNPFAAKCMHCGLRRNATSDPAGTASL